ncbi:hypothetical protein BJX61DRAFT_547834 [Aspergillus egyptiacus]|nr:hypothetical protein BJX61DRAFT_547834 [Aspergillus egyptiacus]
MASQPAGKYGPLPTHGLPQAPRPDQKSLLVIILTDLAPFGKAELLTRLRQTTKDEDENSSTALLQPWHPPKSSFLQPIADQRRYLLPKYNKDSKANIYGFAILARRMGWKSFVVADELTKRQLRCEVLPKEDETLSIVMISIRPGLSSPPENDNVRVLAKRQDIPLDESFTFTLWDLLDTFEISYGFLAKEELTINEHLYDYGLELKDPTRGVFEPNSGTMTGREELELGARMALSETTPLPYELVNMVVEMLYDNDERIFDKPTIADPALDLYIFCLFSQSLEEYWKLDSLIQGEAKRFESRWAYRGDTWDLIMVSGDFIDWEAGQTGKSGEANLDSKEQFLLRRLDDPSLRGIQYARVIPADAYKYGGCILSGTEALDDYVPHRVRFYRRPGWGISSDVDDTDTETETEFEFGFESGTERNTECGRGSAD